MLGHERGSGIRVLEGTNSLGFEWDSSGRDYGGARIAVAHSFTSSWV